MQAGRKIRWWQPCVVKRPEESRVKYFLPTPRKIKGNIGHNIVCARALERAYKFDEKFSSV